MIKLDRCGWCKHELGYKGLIAVCKAFPDGKPREFEENEGHECANGYFFQLKDEKAELYDKCMPKTQNRDIAKLDEPIVLNGGRIIIE